MIHPPQKTMEVVGVATQITLTCQIIAQAIIVRPAHMSLGHVKVVQILMRITIALWQILMMEVAFILQLQEKLLQRM
jgi:hypothetical protein